MTKQSGEIVVGHEKSKQRPTLSALINPTTEFHSLRVCSTYNSTW